MSLFIRGLIVGSVLLYVVAPSPAYGDCLLKKYVVQSEELRRLDKGGPISSCFTRAFLRDLQRAAEIMLADWESSSIIPVAEQSSLLIMIEDALETNGASLMTPFKGKAKCRGTSSGGRCPRAPEPR